MFGKDEEIEKIKAALVATDSDMAAFKSWQKKYEKLNRQWQSTQMQYENARVATEWMNDGARSACSPARKHTIRKKLHRSSRR